MPGRTGHNHATLPCKPQMFIYDGLRANEIFYSINTAPSTDKLTFLSFEAQSVSLSPVSAACGARPVNDVYACTFIQQLGAMTYPLENDINKQGCNATALLPRLNSDVVCVPRVNCSLSTEICRHGVRYCHWMCRRCNLRFPPTHY
jgi:hypothetical protein